MAGFQATPPPAQISDGAGAGDIVAGDAFWPGVSVAAVREALRLPTVATDDRLRNAIVAGMISATRELRQWKAARIGQGYASLADVPADTIDGKSVLLLLWQRAVASFAGADLVETHHDISATGTGKDRIEEDALTSGDHRRNALHAIRDMLDVTRTAVELI